MNVVPSGFSPHFHFCHNALYSKKRACVCCPSHPHRNESCPPNYARHPSPQIQTPDWQTDHQGGQCYLGSAAFDGAANHGLLLDVRPERLCLLHLRLLLIVYGIGMVFQAIIDLKWTVFVLEFRRTVVSRVVHGDSRKIDSIGTDR